MSRNAREQSVLETLGLFLTWNGAMGTLLPVDHCLAWRRRLLERRKIRVPDVSDDWLNHLATESPKHTDEG